MEEEIWLTKDGQGIAIGDMDEEHVRNALRLVLRKRRLKVKKEIAALELYPITDGEIQDHLDAVARDHTGMVFDPRGYWYRP